MYDARQPANILLGTLAAKTVSATGDFSYNQVLLEPASVSRLLCKVTTTIDSASASCTVTFYARPTYGSTSSQVSLGAVILPHTTAANVVVYKDVADIAVPAGYQIVANCSVAATTAGAAVAGVLMQYSPETVANEGFVASA